MPGEIQYVEDIGFGTSEKDNTREERRKALLFLGSMVDTPEELDELRRMLGIEKEWLTGDPEDRPSGQRRRASPRRITRNGVFRV